MNSHASFLKETVEDLMAALPPEDLVEHSRNIVRNYVDNNAQNIGELKWIEFDVVGSPVRGGISSAEHMSTRLLSNWDDDADLQEIIEFSHSHQIRAGELIPTSGKENYFWCIPYRPDQKSFKPENRVRAILINENLLSQILVIFNEDTNLTTAEKRIIFQILIGQNPPAAAKRDRVSPETKRSQLKSACTKLDCHGQSALMRLVVSQMVHLLYVCEAESSQMHLIESFTSRFFSESTRLLAQRLSNGNLVRYWEFGPRDGRPILVMHGYLFPFLVLDSEKIFTKHNIRLIFPLRTGFLDSQSSNGVLKIETLAEENLENLELFSDLINEEMSILGHNMGAVYALKLAKRKPQYFKHVIAASACLMQERKEADNSVAFKFVNGMRKLAKDTNIYEIAVRQFQKAVLMNNQVARVVLHRIFKDSQHDLAVINGTQNRQPAFKWFREIAVNSVLGASSDLALIAKDTKKMISDVPIPLYFLHAPDDPYTSIDELHELASCNKNSTCMILEAGGHYVSASHAEDFWQAIDNLISA